MDVHQIWGIHHVFHLCSCHMMNESFYTNKLAVLQIICLFFTNLHIKTEVNLITQIRPKGYWIVIKRSSRLQHFYLHKNQRKKKLPGQSITIHLLEHGYCFLWIKVWIIIDFSYPRMPHVLVLICPLQNIIHRRHPSESFSFIAYSVLNNTTAKYRYCILDLEKSSSHCCSENRLEEDSQL